MDFKISQGVTTVIAGNCGISAAPLVRGMKLPMPLDLLDGPDGPDGERHQTFASWVGALTAKPAAINVAALVGHSTLRVATMDDVDREATSVEIAAMRKLLVEALEAGAIGLSTGTFYPPAVKASTEEIIEIGRPLAAHGGVYVTHMRDESSRVMEALDETFRIGRELGIPVVVSHHKVQNRPNFGRSAETLAFIRESMKRQQVCLDCYPYTAGSTMIRTDRGMLDGANQNRLAFRRQLVRGRGRRAIRMHRARGRYRRGRGEEERPGRWLHDRSPDGRPLINLAC